MGTPRARVAHLVSIYVVMSFLGSSCQNVAGRLRPNWNPAWSKSTCKISATPKSFIELDVTVKDGYGSGLPGATVAARYLGERAGQPAPWRLDADEYTNADGFATLRLQPGKWRVTASLTGVHEASRTINLRAGERCIIGFFTTPENMTVITQLG